MKRFRKLALSILAVITIIASARVPARAETAVSKEETLAENEFEYTAGEEILLCENENAAVILKSITEKDSSNYSWKLLLQNKMESTDLLFTMEEVLLNGYIMGPGVTDIVAAGMQKVSTASWSDYTGQFSFSDIACAEITFLAYDADTYSGEDLLKEHVIIYPHGKENVILPEFEPEDDDVVLVDDDTLFFAVTGTRITPIGDYCMDVYAENRSGHPITLSIDSTSLNGFMADAYWGIDMPAGSKYASYLSWIFLVFDDLDFSVREVSQIGFTLRQYTDSTRYFQETSRETFTYFPNDPEKNHSVRKDEAESSSPDMTEETGAPEKAEAAETPDAEEMTAMGIH